MLTAKVHIAKIPDQDAIKLLLNGVRDRLPRLSHLWVDAGYQGRGKEWAEQELGLSVEVVHRTPKPTPEKVARIWAEEWAKEGHDRAGIRGSAVKLSRRQFPDIYAVKEDFARRLRLKRNPEVYLMSSNGVLNAFAASTFGYDFVVIHSELFSNTYEKNKDALAFIIGHELGYLRLGHTRHWYQLSAAYVDWVPLLGGFLSRAREYSCDRHGAYLERQEDAPGIVGT